MLINCIDSNSAAADALERGGVSTVGDFNWGTQNDNCD